MILEIQACMPSPPATFRPYMRRVYIAYGVVSWAYFGVAFTGYWVRALLLFTLQRLSTCRCLSKPLLPAAATLSPSRPQQCWPDLNISCICVDVLPGGGACLHFA